MDSPKLEKETLNPVGIPDCTSDEYTVGSNDDVSNSGSDDELTPVDRRRCKLSEEDSCEEEQPTVTEIQSESVETSKKVGDVEIPSEKEIIDKTELEGQKPIFFDEAKNLRRNLPNSRYGIRNEKWTNDKFEELESSFKAREAAGKAFKTNANSTTGWQHDNRRNTSNYEKNNGDRGSRTSFQRRTKNPSIQSQFDVKSKPKSLAVIQELQLIKPEDNTRGGSETKDNSTPASTSCRSYYFIDDSLKNINPHNNRRTRLNSNHKTEPSPIQVLSSTETVVPQKVVCCPLSVKRNNRESSPRNSPDPNFVSNDHKSNRPEVIATSGSKRYTARNQAIVSPASVDVTPVSKCERVTSVSMTRYPSSNYQNVSQSSVLNSSERPSHYYDQSTPDDSSPHPISEIEQSMKKVTVTPSTSSSSVIKNDSNLRHRYPYTDYRKSRTTGTTYSRPSHYPPRVVPSFFRPAGGTQGQNESYSQQNFAEGYHDPSYFVHPMYYQSVYPFGYTDPNFQMMQMEYFQSQMQFPSAAAAASANPSMYYSPDMIYPNDSNPAAYMNMPCFPMDQSQHPSVYHNPYMASPEMYYNYFHQAPPTTPNNTASHKNNLYQTSSTSGRVPHDLPDR